MNMPNRKIFLLLILLFLGLAVASCSLQFNTGNISKGPDGGIFLSANKGETWKQMVSVPTVKGVPESIGAMNASFLAIDPSDSETLYFGTTNGIFYTYDIVQGWNQIKILGKEEIRAIAVNPKNKCVVYAASANKVYRTDDCSRTWSQIYFDNDPQTTVTFIIVDHYESDRLYLGTSRGELIKSLDGGKSWQTVLRSESSVVKVVLSPQDSRVIFVGTDKKGIFRSIDGGDNWLALSDNMEEFKNSSRVRDMAAAADEEGLIFAATTYGLLKSSDNGNNWERIELITPQDETTINALAVNSRNSKEIYYVTNTAFYSSFDGGGNWVTGKLPGSRAGWVLLVNPDNENILYLGVRSIKN